MLKIVKDGKVLHQVEIPEDERALGLPLVRGLCVFLYTLPDEERSAFLSYILDSASVNPQDMAEALGVTRATIVRRISRASRLFSKMYEDKDGMFDARPDLEIVEEDEL